MDDVNIIFWKFNFWRHHELFGSGRGRVTENGPVNISWDLMHVVFKMLYDTE